MSNVVSGNTRGSRRTAAAPDVAESLRVVGCTCARVRRLARRVTQVYDRALAPSGLRVTQFSLLSQLLVQDGMTMAPLAAALDMDRTTLTRNLKPLVDAGLVAMRPSAEDARMRIVQLTPEGRARQRQAGRQWRQAQDGVNGLLGGPRVASLHELFDELIETFNVRTDAKDAG